MKAAVMVKEPDLSEVIKYNLQRRGWDVVNQANSLCRVVIIDDDNDNLRKMVQETGLPTVIIASHDKDYLQEQHGLVHGEDYAHHIQKPFSLEKLTEKIEKYR